MNRREAKRHQTALRLQECAVRLTIDRGFDGWTIDDLAAAADVSRRTVFNYFDGKAEVILGPEPDVDEEAMAAFVSGGPTGRLFDDLLVLAHEATREKADSERHIAAVRDAIMNDPHLLRLVHERFEMAAALLGDCIRRREGDDFPDEKVRLLLRLLMTCFDHALARLGEDASTTFTDHFDATVVDIRACLA
ncbi:TetR/AcrR family transcriptional regulator [Nocardioides humi]|nr:TetR/AcrR family transcriptional regulator [Nocardioides humi]